MPSFTFLKQKSFFCSKNILKKLSCPITPVITSSKKAKKLGDVMGGHVRSRLKNSIQLFFKVNRGSPNGI
jgi:hypothetical protein